MSILDWLRAPARPETDQSEIDTVRRIARKLEELEPSEARYVACFAYLLGRVAHADLDISDEETAAMERIVSDTAGLPESQAVLVVHMARTHNELFGATENFLVTREFADLASVQQRRQLLECLYAVSAADASISAEEDHEIRRIASELKLTHRDFIAARSRYAGHLDLLRDDTGDA